LKKNGLANLKAFGSIEFSYENETDEVPSEVRDRKEGRSILHYHLVFPGVQRETLGALRNCFSNRSLNRQVLIQELQNGLEDRAKIFSYCCKRVDYYRPKIIKDGKTSYSYAIPMPTQYRRVLLNYLSKYRMSELQLYYNITFTQGIITGGCG
jgi:hypothetical protein